jgi:hypothetical protein
MLDAQYSTFGREVKAFNDHIEKLQHSIERVNTCRSQWPLAPSPQDELDLAPLNRLVGDYKSTLIACQKFLDKNAAFEKDGAGIIKRIRWSSLLADDISEMRDRIHFHNVRLTALLKPMELTLHARLREDIRNLHEGMQAGFEDVISRLNEIKGYLLGNLTQAMDQAQQPLPEELPPVPAFLRGSFALAAQSQAGDVSDHIKVSSLIGHFARGTSKFRSAAGEGPSTPEPSQYVSLWKAVWIARQLQSVSVAAPVSTQNLSALVIKQHEKSLLNELKRFNVDQEDLIFPDDHEIENLPATEFAIWIFEPSKPRQRLLDPRPDEFRIFECPLVDPSENEIHHVVLSATRSQRNILRVVTTSRSKSGNDGEDREVIEVDLNEVRLFPTYAQPNATVFNLQLRASSHSATDKFFSFKSLPELHAFQQCFTSFYVKLDLPDLLKLTLKEGGLFSGVSRAHVLANYGRVQIWAHELSEGVKSTSNIPTMTPSRRAQHLSVSSENDSNLVSQTTSSRSASKTLVNWTSIHAPSVIWREDHTELPYPEPPLMVLLIGEIRPGRDDTMIDAFRLLSVPLNGSVIVDQSKCGCRNQDDICTKVIITSGGRSTLTARLFDYGTDVMGMNLAALRVPEQHKHVEEKFHLKEYDDVGRIALEFTNVKDKKDFRERLSSVSDNYIGLWQDYQAHKNRIRKADHVDRQVS